MAVFTFDCPAVIGYIFGMYVSGIEPYSPWSGYATIPALQSMQTRLAAQERQAMAAAQNVMNMIDYNRTRDSWMQSIDNMALRMAELAVSANDGTKNPVDRAAIQAEFSQMQRGIQSITSGPYAMGKFNGLFLFQG